MSDGIDSASHGAEQETAKKKILVLKCARCGKRYPPSSGLKSCPGCSGGSNAATKAQAEEESERRCTKDNEEDVSLLRLLGYFVSALFLLFLIQLGWAIWHMTFLLK